MAPGSPMQTTRIRYSVSPTIRYTTTWVRNDLKFFTKCNFILNVLVGIQITSGFKNLHTNPGKAHAFEGSAMRFKRAITVLLYLYTHM
jgi:hypothetical protein